MSTLQDTQFIDFLIKQFDRIDTRFNSIDQRFAKIDQKFDQIDERFEKIDIRFNTIENKITNLQNTQDFMLGELKLLSEDKIVSSYRSRRMESWIEKAAKKLEIPYTP